MARKGDKGSREIGGVGGVYDTESGIHVDLFTNESKICVSTIGDADQRVGRDRVGCDGR